MWKKSSSKRKPDACDASSSSGSNAELTRKRMKGTVRFNPMAIMGPERSCVIPFGAMDFRSESERAAEFQDKRASTAVALRTCREIISVSAERNFLRGLNRLHSFEGNIDTLIEMDKRVFRGLMLATAVFNPELTIPVSAENDDEDDEPLLIHNSTTDT